MKAGKITDRKEYDEVMKRIEKLLQKSSKSGGFKNLSAKETESLNKLSLMAEEFEDNLPLMPIK